MFGIVCILISQMQGFFAKSYGTTRDNRCFSVIQTQDGGYAMSGYSGNFLNNGNFLVIKVDSAGVLQWAYEYFQSSVAYDEFAWPIVQASDGSYYVAGHGFVDPMSSTNDIVLLKLNSSGGVQWAKSYGNPSYTDYAHTMTMLSDGGLAIAGHGIVNPFPTGQDAIVMKLTPNGDVVWAKQYADVNQDHCYGVIQTTDGGIVVSGFTVRSGSSDFDIMVIRLDGFGNTLWAKAYGIPGQNDFGLSVAQLNDGDLVVAGYIGNFGGGVLKIRLSDGALLWTEAFATVYLDYFYRPQITKTSDGGFVIPAFTSSCGGGTYDFLPMKFSSAGALEWARTFGASGYDIATCAIQKPDGRFAISGMTMS
ncbi:MAG: sialidase family protein, partial [Candidatus Hydrothermia bacterium]